MDSPYLKLLSGLDFGLCPGNGFMMLVDTAKALSAANMNGTVFVLSSKDRHIGLKS